MNEEEQKAKDLAISSLAISVACIPLTLGFLSFIGAIVGHIALGKLQQTQNQSHRGFAIAGIIVGWTASALSVIGLAIVVILFAGFLGSTL
jgi:Domain of unknown function (DUF4190)